jgi:hypothetical protein
MTFKAVVPIHFEFDGVYDSHDSSTEVTFHFKHSFIHKGMNIYIESSDCVRRIEISNIVAHDEINAFIIVKSLMPHLVQCLSFFMQRKNINQHHGHVRLVWHKREVRIATSVSPSSFLQTDASLSTSLTISLATDDFDMAFHNILGSDKNMFMSQALYGALQSQDINSKFYSAFTIIEFIEHLHREVGTRRFNKTICKKVSSLTYNVLKENNMSEDDAAAAKAFVTESLSRATIENRETKLVNILTSIYGISHIAYPTPEEQITINTEVTRNLIKIRNSLFHAQIDRMNEISKAEMKRYTDYLILICTKIVMSSL